MITLDKTLVERFVSFICWKISTHSVFSDSNCGKFTWNFHHNYTVLLDEMEEDEIIQAGAKNVEKGQIKIDLTVHHDVLSKLLMYKILDK